MRLLKTDTLEFEEFLGPNTPPYAILSHTWQEEEVSLREMTDRGPSVTRKKGYRKVADYCLLAAQLGYAWAWVDTCCIDKTNHAELAESINSMFRWYQEAAVCHVFLSDLPVDAELKHALPHCRWFTRGWTLQELIAPATVQFYDQAWVLRGTKENLVAELEAITGITKRVLNGSMHVRSFCVAVRMSWAANRETTRPEDKAYCLLGMFDVNMPMIYGEGDKAFRRLQEEIIRQDNDLTIFAWAGPAGDAPLSQPTPGCLLAPSPSLFARHSSQNSRGWLSRLGDSARWADPNPEYTVTNKGLRIRASLVRLRGDQDRGPQYFLPLGEVRHLFETPGLHNNIPGIVLQKIGPNQFLRKDGFLHSIPLETQGSRIAVPDLTPSLEFYIAIHSYAEHFRHRWIKQHGAIMLRTGNTPITGIKPGSTSPHAVIRLERAVPESHWDQTNRLFYGASENRSTMVYAIAVAIQVEQELVHLLCLIDQRTNGLPFPYLFDPLKHRDLYRWFYRRKSASEACFWEDLPDPWAQQSCPLPDWSQNVTIGGVSHSIMAVSVFGSSTNSYDINFNVKRLPQRQIAAGSSEPSPAYAE
ncbi:heterokaryon incompatibility protein-domain-containing protein [Parachaetomium inaequale]|uniref:Heterokaryon incompatibility protein-domain-containing protein n=1 Tax=Parachaetomium inaequale TaxID=2588326 RepID=A0AAN6SVL6_9PEZI|nr:heterokaryon incompatibility protein-domain-containing protein [Parachaetomium inaequale]